MAIDYDTPEYAGDFILEPLGTPRSQQVETTLLVDLRRHPRFDTRLHAEISVGNGNRANGIITNISRTGLRLEGGRHMVDAIVPGHNMRSEHSPVTLELQFSLPGGKEQAPAPPRQRACEVVDGIEGLVTVACAVAGGESGAPLLRKIQAGLELVAVLSSSSSQGQQPVGLASDVALRLPPLQSAVNAAEGS